RRRRRAAARVRARARPADGPHPRLLRPGRRTGGAEDAAQAAAWARPHRERARGHRGALRAQARVAEDHGRRAGRIHARARGRRARNNDPPRRQRRAGDERGDVRYYMACLDLRGRDCLVVGGGRVATEKVHGLLDCDARVTAVAPQIEDELRRLPVRVERRAFSRSDVVGRFLVVAATSDRSVNADVSSVARERETLCNVADDPELCSFILPAIVRRDPIVVGVSTGGASPALAQRLRDDIAALVGPRHADLARRLAELRPWAKRTLPTYEARRDYFQKLVSEV